MTELGAERPPSILIREIHAKDDPAFLDAMELYVESFPRDEREPVRAFARLLEYSRSLLRLDALATASELKAIFFECERVCDARTPEQTLERRSRLDYFARRSGTVVSGTYVQPAARKGSEPLPLNLMAYRLADGLDRADMVRGFYKGFMGIEGDDPLLAEALRGTSDDGPR